MPVAKKHEASQPNTPPQKDKLPSKLRQAQLSFVSDYLLSDVYVRPKGYTDKPGYYKFHVPRATDEVERKAKFIVIPTSDWRHFNGS